MTSSADPTVQTLTAYLERKLLQLADATRYPFFTGPDDRLYYIYLLSFVVIGLGVYFWERRRTGSFSPGSMFRYLFPGAIYLHRSSLLDYKYYVVNRVVMKAVNLFNLGVVYFLVGTALERTLSFAVPGLRGAADPSSVAFLLVFGVVNFVVLDFAAFFLHYLHHKIPLLWEFHKVHHTAQVLTPITNYRNHPVNNMIDEAGAGVIGGAVYGLFVFAGGVELTEPAFLTIGALNIGVFLFATNIFQNLMHSHIWMSYGKVLDHVFISPAQHQIHHSAEPRHYDRNMGLVFSVWDQMFGTHYRPQQREQFAMGLADSEHDDYDSLKKIYVVPFRKAVRMILRTRPRTAASLDTIGPDLPS